jgi:hypothetical protein
MATSLLDAFRNLSKDTKETLADLESPILIAFAALSIAQEISDSDRLSSEHITACLEAAGVSISKLSISRALARADDRVSSSPSAEGDTLYRLMTKGKREIAPYIGGTGLMVIHLEGNKPWTDRMRLGELLSNLTGKVRICDPYYGIRTLDTLHFIPNSCAVNFLTSKTSEPQTKLAGPLQDFKKEHPNIEFRKVLPPSYLHDRYVHTSKFILLIGHGLKDIGGKESFITRIDKKIIPGIIHQIANTFDTNWKAAKPI